MSSKCLVYLCLNADTGYAHIEEKCDDGPIEKNAFGEYVRFCKNEEEALCILARIQRNPSLIEHYIKTL